jgi:hypothetical protein
MVFVVINKLFHIDHIGKIVNINSHYIRVPWHIYHNLRLTRIDKKPIHKKKKKNKTLIISKMMKWVPHFDLPTILELKAPMKCLLLNWTPFVNH